MTMKPKILFIDDDANLLAAFQRNYRNKFNFDVALGGEEAIRLMHSAGPYAVVVADMNMPEMNGVEVLEQIRELAPRSVRMMLTGNADQETAIKAVNRGEVFRFLNKPCPPDILVPAIEAALKEYHHRQLEREMLESTVAGSIKMLTEVLGLVSPDALGRGQHLRDLLARFASAMRIDDIWAMEMAALLSPVGYAAMPAPVLQRVATGGDLSPGETAMVRRMPQIGYQLLADIPRLKPVAEIVLYQSQNFDGSDLPSDGKNGEDLPLGSRMLKILNDRIALEASGATKNAAFLQMRERVGMYDPELLGKCFDFLPSIQRHDLAAEGPVVTATLEDLQIGDVLAANIVSNEGVTLARSGGKLTPMTLEYVTNFARLGEVQGPFSIRRPKK